MPRASELADAPRHVIEVRHIELEYRELKLESAWVARNSWAFQIGVVLGCKQYVKSYIMSPIPLIHLEDVPLSVKVDHVLGVNFS